MVTFMLNTNVPVVHFYSAAWPNIPPPLTPWAAIDKKSGRWIGKIGLNLLDDWPEQHKWKVGWELDPEFWG